MCISTGNPRRRWQRVWLDVQVLIAHAAMFGAACLVISGTAQLIPILASIFEHWSDVPQ
jgi:hypothetical protein